MSNQRFDLEGFYSALDSQRRSKGMTWKAVASATGVAASTLTRMGQGKRPDVDGLAALASWSGLEVSDFYNPKPPGKARPEILAQITALLRADNSLDGPTAMALENMVKSVYEQTRKKVGDKQT